MWIDFYMMMTRRRVRGREVWKYTVFPRKQNISLSKMVMYCTVLYTEHRTLANRKMDCYTEYTM